jgi:hypothetical protein
MSSSETTPNTAELAACLAQAAAGLAAAVDDPGSVVDETLQSLICSAVRLYAAKAEVGLASPFPPRGGGVSVDEMMITASDMLHALNVQLFELSMWQAMTGHCIKSSDRIDSTV